MPLSVTLQPSPSSRLLPGPLSKPLISTLGVPQPLAPPCPLCPGPQLHCSSSGGRSSPQSGPLCKSLTLLPPYPPDPYRSSSSRHSPQSGSLCTPRILTPQACPSAPFPPPSFLTAPQAAGTGAAAPWRSSRPWGRAKTGSGS